MASQRTSWLIGAFFLLLSAKIASSSKTTIIDNEGIETVAESVCRLTRGSHTQIGRVSTINQLVAFFENLSPGHKRTACRDKYLEALSQLQQVVSQSNDNVCSEQKLSLIERFHHDFISRTWRDRRQQKSGKLVAPKMLVLFFVHYVAKVSATCKQSLMQQVMNGTASTEQTGDPKNLEALDGLLREFSTKLGASSELKSYDDITLLWNLVDKFPLNDEDAKYLSGPGNRKRMFLKAHSGKADEIESFQRECSSRLRPNYATSVLPVLRLADLGYYQDKEQFAEELASHLDLRRLIGVAQVCEAFLPLKVFRDESLRPSQAVFITREEAGSVYKYEVSELEDIQASTTLESPEQNSLVSLDSLSTVNPEGGYRLVKSIKINIKGRERIFRHLFSVMSGQLRNTSKSLAGKLFFSSKIDNGYVKQDLATVDSDKVVELSDEEPKPLADGALVRRKRECRIFILDRAFIMLGKFIGFMLFKLISYPIRGIMYVLEKYDDYIEDRKEAKAIAGYNLMKYGPGGGVVYFH